MADRSGIFAGDDPLEIARHWLAEAEKSEPSDPNAISLATVDKDGMPDLRTVLIKGIDDKGFVFFTNYESAKGQQLIASGKAAMNFHWKSLTRQLRVRGTVTKVSAVESDDYYHSRPLGSRIGAWASRQSKPLTSKAELAKAVAAEGLKHGLSPSRPAFWGGFRLVPVQMEFWSAGEFRLHDRFQWVASGDGTWQIQRLSP